MHGAFFVIILTDSKTHGAQTYKNVYSTDMYRHQVKMFSNQQTTSKACCFQTILNYVYMVKIINVKSFQ